MLPVLRAAADQVWYDDANLILIAAILPADGLDRRAAGGWTAGQLIAHIAARQDAVADIVERFLAGEDIPGPCFAPCQPDEAPVAPIEDLLAALRGSRDRLFAALERVKFARGQQTLAGARAVETIFAWTRHAAGHALDFASAEPGLADNPMVLNWVLWPVYPEESELGARQAALFEAVKERLVAHTEEGSNRKRNLAKRLVKKR